MQAQVQCFTTKIPMNQYVSRRTYNAEVVETKVRRDYRSRLAVIVIVILIKRHPSDAAAVNQLASLPGMASASQGCQPQQL